MVDDPSDGKSAQPKVPPPPKLSATREHERASSRTDAPGSEDEVDEEAETNPESPAVPEDLFDDALPKRPAAKPDISGLHNLDELFGSPSKTAPPAASKAGSDAKAEGDAREDDLFSRSPEPQAAAPDSDDSDDPIGMLLGAPAPTEPRAASDANDQDASNPDSADALLGPGLRPSPRTASSNALIDALHASLGAKTPSRAASVVPRKGALPPPPSDGHRPRAYVRERGEGAAASHPRSSASGLPRGVRPPGAPVETEHEDTDVLIASAVELLTAGEPVSTDEAPAPSASSSSAAAIVAASDNAAAAVNEAPSPPAGLPRWMLAAGVAVIVLAITCALWPDGEDARQERSAAADVQPAAQHKPVADAVPDAAQEPAVVAKAEPEREPEPEPLAEDAAPDLGTLPSEDIVVTDTDAEVDGDASAESAQDPAEAEDTADEANARSKKSSRKRKRSRKRNDGSASSTAPVSKPAPASDETAASLLADARAALRSGKNRSAYTLASKSRSKKRTSDALIVMARAACRMGDAAKAKRAFDQLSVGQRRGIRGECRDKGVRLGL